MKWPNIFPREAKFLHFMESQSVQALDVSRQLKIFIEVSNDQNASAEIDRLRASSKTLVTEITSELCRAFITPFDREDIQDFSDIMYNVPKVVHKIKNRIMMHKIPLEDSGFIKQADLIVQEAVVMHKLVGSLVHGKGSKGVIEGIDQLRELEQKGDEVHNRIIVDLFQSNKDIRVIVLQRDVCDMLERVVDRFRDAAGVALQIVLKHS